ncbi:TorF family putative porin, partial [Acinetobacter baumannii]
GVFSEYRYRGISQSRLKPALQGGIDYAAANGFYVGTWASTIKWIKDAGGNANVEVDLYGGYKTEVAKGLTLDVGGLYYLYPNNKLKDVSG